MNATQYYDVIVFEATPGGIAAALAAAREGCRTLLVSSTRDVGGMTASGLCTTDAVRRSAFGGIMLEFVRRVREHYLQTHGEASDAFRLCQDGWWYEPHVAALIFNDMLAAQANLTLLRERELVAVQTGDARRIASVTLRSPDGVDTTCAASTFIDASYEGDLAAMAGVPARVGREARGEFDESLAGVTYFDWKRGRLHPATTGEAHPGIQAYCFRQTLTDDPANQVRVEKPRDYDDVLPDFLPLLGDIDTGRVRCMEDVTMTNVLPNRKIDANGQIEGLTSFNLSGGNWAYPEATPEQRRPIVAHHRLHAHSLLYFMQNDSRVPATIRAEFNRWHFCADEYPHNDHQPFQLYVRQARRIVGRVTLTQHDYTIAPGSTATPRHDDSIAVAEHSFDIHPCQDRAAAKDGWMEGVLWYPNKAHGPAQPGQVPYRAMLPEAFDNLLVPVAMSATHVAFSVLRMEPVWMATGQAAGLAAALAKQGEVDAAAIDVTRLQEQLRQRGQVITFGEDEARATTPDEATTH